MREFGYARVSTKEQHPDRQVDALMAFGIKKENIFIDRESGKDFNRPAWQDLMDEINYGDLLVVKSIDRLGRNYSEILEVWRFLVKEMQVSLIVLDMPLLDTRQTGDLTRQLITDIILQLLSYVAETERTMIRERQKEGIACAKARGVTFGRPKKPIPDGFPEVYERVRSGEISRNEGAKSLGISAGTFARMSERFEAGEKPGTPHIKNGRHHRHDNDDTDTDKKK